MSQVATVMDRATERVVVPNLQIADRFWSRLVGRQGRRPFAPGEALLIVPCRSVHTCFVREPLDLLMLDRQGQVLQVRRNVAPWRFVVAPADTHAILETAVGECDVQTGDWLAVQIPEPSSRRSAIFAALLACAVVGWGCSKTSEPAPEVCSIPSEEQVAAVRSGTTQRIELTTEPVTDDDLADVAHLRSLRELLLDDPHNRLTLAGLKNLRGCESLEHLRLRGVVVTDDLLPPILTLSELRILNLPAADLSDQGFAELSQLPKLEQLRLRSPRVTAVGLTALQRFPSLLRLHLIDVPVTDAGLRVFHELPRLESLYLDGARVSDAGYQALFEARPKLHVHLNQHHHDHDPHGHAH